MPDPVSPGTVLGGPRVVRSKAHRSYRQHCLVDDVLAAAADDRISDGSAVRLIYAIKKGWQIGHVWWKRTSWAEHWHVDEATISRDYERWQVLGFAKLRRNPFRRSALLLIFPWSRVWDDEVWNDQEKVASMLPELRCNHATQKGRTDATCSRFHPIYESSKEEISKQQAAVGEPGPPKKPLSASPPRGVAPAPPLLQSRASATRHLALPSQ